MLCYYLYTGNTRYADHYLLPQPLLTFFSKCTALPLGGAECLLGPAGEAGNDSRFFTELTDGDDPFSGVGVAFFSNPDELGLANRDRAFVDFLGVKYL